MPRAAEEGCEGARLAPEEARPALAPTSSMTRTAASPCLGANSVLLLWLHAPRCQQFLAAQEAQTHRRCYQSHVCCC